jgi:flagellar biosynthesis/type III secretory pathway protein FliH
MTKTAKKLICIQMAELLKHVEKGEHDDVKKSVLEIMRLCNADGFDLGKEEGHDEGYSEGKDEGYHEGYAAKEEEGD